MVEYWVLKGVKHFLLLINDKEGTYKQFHYAVYTSSSFRADKSIMICVSTKAWSTSIAVLMVIISSFSGIKFVHDGCHCLDH